MSWLVPGRANLRGNLSVQRRHLPRSPLPMGPSGKGRRDQRTDVHGL